MATKFGSSNSNSKYNHHNSKPLSYKENEMESVKSQKYNERGGMKFNNYSNNPYLSKPLNQSSDIELNNLYTTNKSSNPYPYNNQSYRSYEFEEATLLKEKLVQIHQKLLKELENNNSLKSQIDEMQAVIDNLEKANYNLEQNCNHLEDQSNQIKRELDHQLDKNQEKYKSFEAKIESQSRKNNAMKDQLEGLRSKVLELTMEKNMLEDANGQFKLEIKNMESHIEEIERQLKSKDQEIDNLNSELNNNLLKNEREQKTINQLQYQVDQLARNLNKEKSSLKQVEHLFSLQQQKNMLQAQEIEEMQVYMKQIEQKLKFFQKENEIQKEQIYYLKQDKEKLVNKHYDETFKLTDQLNAVLSKCRDLQKELGLLKTKPVVDAEKKKRHYELTKQFVNQLENEQQKYQNVGSRAVYGNSNSKQTPISRLSPSPQYINNKSKDLSPSSKNISYFQNKANIPKPSNNNSYSYKNLGNSIQEQSSFKEEKKSSFSNNDQVQLQQALHVCNQQHRKIKMEIDKIEGNATKTREMVIKKKRLEEELEFQEQKIKKIREDLRKMRVA